MGCVRARELPADPSPEVDVLIAPSHNLVDDRAKELIRWLKLWLEEQGQICFYEEGLSGSLSLTQPQRRRLRDAFQVCSCLCVVACKGSLTNEALWAEQHEKPLFLLCDAMPHWDESPWLLAGPVVEFAQGHCKEELLEALQNVGKSKTSKTPSHSGQTNRGDQGQAGQSRQTSQSSEAVQGGQAEREMELMAALEVLAAAEAPELAQETRGILKRSLPAPKRVFQPTQERLRAAAQVVCAHLEANTADPALCLRLGLGVSEEVVSRALRLEPLVEPSELCLTLRQHPGSVDVCTHAVRLLVRSTPGLGEAELIVATLNSYPAAEALQQHGAAVLVAMLAEEAEAGEDAFALRGGGPARVLQRLGVAELGLQAAKRHPRNGQLLASLCQLWTSLAASSRDAKLMLTSAAALELWPSLLPDVLPLLSCLAEGEAKAKAALAAAPLLRQLERLADAEALALLCRITARHDENKLKVLQETQLLEQAEQCCLRRAPDSLKLAAAGLLVNLCGVPEGRSRGLARGFLEPGGVVDALRARTGDLRRCGDALARLLDAPAKKPASAFDGVFVQRPGFAPRQKKERERRGPGWRRLPGGEAFEAAPASALPAAVELQWDAPEPELPALPAPVADLEALPEDVLRRLSGKCVMDEPEDVESVAPSTAPSALHGNFSALHLPKCHFLD